MDFGQLLIRQADTLQFLCLVMILGLYLEALGPKILYICDKNLIVNVAFLCFNNGTCDIKVSVKCIKFRAVDFSWCHPDMFES